jgi:hypothetical protein
VLDLRVVKSIETEVRTIKNQRLSATLTRPPTRVGFSPSCQLIEASQEVIGLKPEIHESPSFLGQEMP